MSTDNFSGVDRGAGDNSVAWADLTLAASWANVAGYATAQVSRDPEGIVHLKGTIDTGTKTAGTTVTTLPVGMSSGSEDGVSRHGEHQLGFGRVCHRDWD